MATRIGIGLLIYDGFGGLNNLGDWYQTAAAMYIWWKHLKIDTPFKLFVEECIRTQKMVEHPIIWLERNTMSKTQTPSHCDKVITICNAWWLCYHEGKFDFPFPPYVEPLFTSVHIACEDILTDSAVDYFKRWSPVGCRDQSTLDMLQKYSIPCYFSGCLTSLLDLRDPRIGFKQSLDYSDADVCVDTRCDYSTNKNLIVYMSQHGPYHRNPRFIIESLQRNYDLLFAKSVRTNRLHVWLPLFSNGGPVVLWNSGKKGAFQVEDADPLTLRHDRFKGIVSIGEDPIKFEQMREALRIDIETRIQRAMETTAQKTPIAAE